MLTVLLAFPADNTHLGPRQLSARYLLAAAGHLGRQRVRAVLSLLAPLDGLKEHGRHLSIGLGNESDMFEWTGGKHTNL